MYKIRMKHPMWDVRDRYALGVIREYNEYIGEVGEAPKYLSNDEWFTLTEEDGNVRILYKDNVLCSWPHTRSSTRSTERNSIRIIRGEKSYIVSLSPRGSFVCNCTGYSYRRTCSHIQEVEETEV